LSPDHRPSPPTGPTGTPPLRQFILKVHARCDLACDYCYVYTMKDRAWREEPRIMSRDTVDRAAARIAEHTRTHDVNEVDLILHGGEPLLAGADLLGHSVRAVRAAVGPGVTVHPVVQTNGVRLDRAFLETFLELGIRVGVSIDGGRSVHDRHRLDHRGRGSHTRVARALRQLMSPRYRTLYAGLLCTVDVRNDPLEVYHGLLEFEPPMIDLLLPHGSWSEPPPGRTPGTPDAPYGRWLAAIFDRWYGSRVHTRIRLFEEIMTMLLGGRSRYEGVGPGTPASVVIRTDGTLQESDHLAAVSGLPGPGLNVTNDALDEILRTPIARARRSGLDALSATCRACALVAVCGGGLYSHRFAVANGFDNPSVYCPDLAYLIRHVRAVLDRDVSALASRSA